MFEVDNQQSYLYMPDCFIHCGFTICSDVKLTTALPIADNITLENSFFPCLFSQVGLEVGTQTAESIASSPCVVDSLLRFVNKNPDTTKNEGWIPDNNSGNYVSVFALKGGAKGDAANTTKGEYVAIVERLNLNSKNTGYIERKALYNRNGDKQTVEWNLSHLFGYMDYEKVSYQLRFRLISNRELNNAFIFHGAPGKKAYLKIDILELLIPHITPSLEIENMITKRLNTNRNISVSFMGRVAVVLEDTYHEIAVINSVMSRIIQFSVVKFYLKKHEKQ